MSEKNRPLLLATYFEMYLRQKLDAARIKQLNDDVSDNLRRQIASTVKNLEEKELRMKLESFNKVMEEVMTKLDNDYIQNTNSDDELPKRNFSSFYKRMKPFITIFAAEFIGTFILMFFGCGSLIDFEGDVPISHHLKSFMFGVAIFLAIQIVGHISACHINPAVSIVALLLGLINYIQFIVYLAAQFTGGIFGFLALKGLFSPIYVQNGFCVTHVSQVSLAQGFFIEVVATTMLCLVLCSVWDPRNAHNSDSLSLRFAFALGILIVIAGPVTGASFNTARSFAAVVFGSSEDWNDQWVYWIAPNLGAFIAVGTYKFFFSEPGRKKLSNKEYLELVT